MATEALTLYQVEDQYLALLETEAMVPPELEEEFRQELEEALLHAVDKREKVVQFLLWLKEQQAAAEKEINRLKERKDRMANVERRMDRYVVGVIRNAGTDSKGRYKKLQAHTALLFLRALPASIDILDDDLVPAEYRRINLTMPLDLWERLNEAHPELEMLDLMKISIRSITADKEAVKRAIEDGDDIPGADLRLAGHDHTLVVK
jgi:hypothetical protein